MSFENTSSKKLTLGGCFLLLFFSVQYLRLEYPTSQLATTPTAAEYKAELCSGVFGSDGSVVSQSEKASAESFIAMAKQGSADFDIKTCVDQKAFGPNFIPALIQSTAPWFLFFFASIFGWLSYSYSCICPNKCPCCSSCRRNVEEKPYTRCELIMPSVFAVIFAGMIIGMGAAGLTYAPGLEKGIVSMRCTFMAALSDIIEPTNATATFPGIQGISNRLAGIMVKLADFSKSVDATFSVDRTTAMQTQQASTLKVVTDQNTDTNFKNKLTYAKNPSNTKTNIKSYFGNGQSTQVLGLFDFLTTPKPQGTYSPPLGIAAFNPLTPLNLYSTLKTFYQGQVVMMDNLQSAVAPFSSSLNFGDTLQVGIDQGKILSQNINNVSTELYDWTAPMGNYAGSITQGLQALYILAIVMSALIIVGLFLLLVLKMYWARGLVHFGWCVYCLVMILGFLCGVVLNPASVLTVEFCDYLDAFLHDQAYFEASQLITPGGTKNILLECFFKEGNILKLMNVTDATSQLGAVVSSINTFQAQSDVILGKGVGNIQSILQDSSTIVQGLADGTYDDYAAGSKDEIATLITKVNTAAGAGTNGCIQIGQKGKCPNGATVDTKSNAATCMHPSLLVKQNPVPGCAAEKTDLTNLQSWFKQQSSLWSVASADVGKISTSNDATQKQFSAYLEEVNQFIDDTVDFVSYNADPKTGLSASMNCNILLSIFQRIYDATCILFVPSLFRCTVLILLISVSMFFGSCAAFCSGLRHYKMSTIQGKHVIPVHNVHDDEDKKLHHTQDGHNGYHQGHVHHNPEDPVQGHYNPQPQYQQPQYQQPHGQEEG